MSLGSLEGSTLFLLAASEPSGLQDKIQASESLQEPGLAVVAALHYPKDTQVPLVQALPQSETPPG